MAKPQQPELHRSSRGATDPASAKSVAGQASLTDMSGPGPIPEDNLPGHHPEREQDKPLAPPRGRQGSKKVKETAVRPLEISVGGLDFTGLQSGPDDGRPVFFLHGFPQTADAWLPALEALSTEGFHCIAPMQRGYSPGARPSETSAYELTNLVGDVLGMADALGHDRFHVVGHDWGGFVAWALAAGHVDHVRTLTVVSTPHPRALSRSMLTSLQGLRLAYAGLFTVPVLPERLLALGGGQALRRLLVASGLPDAQASRYASALSKDGGIAAALRWYRANLVPGRLSSVGEVAVPTTFVWGPGDVALGPAAAKATAREVTGPYRFEVLEGAGHWIPETRPGELLALARDRIGAA